MRLRFGSFSGRWVGVGCCDRRPHGLMNVGSSPKVTTRDASARFAEQCLPLGWSRPPPTTTAAVVEVDHPDVSFPNMRFLYTNERIAPKLLEAGSVHSVHVHLPWAARATRPQRDALVNGRFVSNASDAMAIHGELHIVTDSEAVAEEACGVLTRSRLFAPCLAFPFHEAGVPSSYPAAELLHADIDEALGCKAQQPMFYTRWEKRQPHLPNFRFQGGKGYADAAQGLLTGRGGGR